MSNDWTKMWESKPTPKQEETKVRILPETEPNWQHYRVQAAIAAMQAQLSNPDNKFMMCEDKKTIIAKRAVAYADALIEELKKGEQDD